MIATIILNYNDKSNTLRLAKELEKYSIISLIVIIDNCSPNPDDFLEIKKIANEKIHVIQSDQNGGYSYGNNFGINYANQLGYDFDYYLISNPDIVVTQNVLEEMVCYLGKVENQKVSSVSPVMKYPSGEIFKKYAWNQVGFKTIFLEIFGIKSSLVKPSTDQKVMFFDCLPGSLFLIRREVFTEINYFDDQVFLYYEEDILGVKLKKAGYKQVILTDLSYIHMESVGTLKTFKLKQIRKNLKMSFMYYAKVYLNYGKIKRLFSRWAYSLLNFRIVFIYKRKKRRN